MPVIRDAVLVGASHAADAIGLIGVQIVSDLATLALALKELEDVYRKALQGGTT
ncbi:MAG: hypothetical protein ACREVW_14170 [Burkholderiales bacterium]